MLFDLKNSFMSKIFTNLNILLDIVVDSIFNFFEATVSFKLLDNVKKDSRSFQLNMRIFKFINI